MFGLPEDEGLERERGARELRSARAGSRVPAPSTSRERRRRRCRAGFRAAGVAAGIKPSGGRDVGLLVCDAPDADSAARFTRSGTLAAPVLVTRERCRLDALRAVAVNSGNANAATGDAGLEEAARDAGRRGDGARRRARTRSRSARPA